MTGVSGTGPVVEGVQFTNGWCAIRWMSKRSTVCFYQSLEDVKIIHGHGGRTELVIHDFEPMKKSGPRGGGVAFETFLQTIEEISAVVNSAEDPAVDTQQLHAAMDEVRNMLDRLEAQLVRHRKKAA